MTFNSPDLESLLRRRFPQRPGESLEKYQDRLNYEKEIIESEERSHLLRRSLARRWDFVAIDQQGLDWWSPDLDWAYPDSEGWYENDDVEDEEPVRPRDLEKELGTDKTVYLKYLRTNDWKARRQSVLESANHRCQNCGISDSLQIHHLTYDNIYNESPEDLRVLCSDCHKQIHGK